MRRRSCAGRGRHLASRGRATVFYTGDVNFDDQTPTKGAVFPESEIDVLIIETTRGDSPLPDGFTRAAEEQSFAEAIGRAFARGGCVLVPVFALGKTQEVLAMLYKFKRAKLLDDVPIYIGGLSSKMTEIYDRRANSSPRVLPRLQLFPEVAPFVLNGKTIADSPARPGRIYALSSGMMTPKTLSNIFARRVIDRPNIRSFLSATLIPSRRRESSVVLNLTSSSRSTKTNRPSRFAVTSSSSSSSARLA